MLIAIPLSSVLVGGVMLTLALNSQDALVVDDYYKRGLEINRTLQRDQAATDYSLTATVQFSDSGDVLVRLEAGRGFEYPPHLRLGFHHATIADHDGVLELVRTGSKNYRGSSANLVAGRWYVDLGAPQWRLTGSLTWPTQSVYLAPRTSLP